MLVDNARLLMRAPYGDLLSTIETGVISTLSNIVNPTPPKPNATAVTAAGQVVPVNVPASSALSSLLTPMNIGIGLAAVGALVFFTRKKEAH